MRRLNQPEVYINELKMFTCRVSSLLPLDNGALLAAVVGCCVLVVDVQSGEVVQMTTEAHAADVLCLVSLQGGARVMTGGADAVVKVTVM